ncbi:MAG: VTT domain-containing protein [Thermoanaerobaculia bacterium]
MAELTRYVLVYGLPLIFGIVLLEQLGAPIPALPVLVVAGALSRTGNLSSMLVLLVAVAASVAADSVWYALGRRRGDRILKILCRISLSPDSCVRQTEAVFERWGMPSLLFAKFIPGFSTVAPPLAGAAGARFATFLLYDTGGALLWAGLGVAAGMAFYRAIDRALSLLASLGSGAFVVLAAALAAFIAFKWWQRRRFYKMLRMARISVDELRRLIDDGERPIVVDVRTAGARARDPRRIPGAAVVEVSELDTRLSELPRDREVILYCT